MPASLQRGLEQLRLNVLQIGPNFDRFLDEQCDQAAVAGTIYMKGNARWKDDAGNRKDRIPGAARAGLTAERTPANGFTEFNHLHKEITFSHGVYYGIWLETRHHGKFAIIMQSVKAIGEALMLKLEDGLARVADEHRA